MGSILEEDTYEKLHKKNASSFRKLKGKYDFGNVDSVSLKKEIYQ